MNRSSSNSSRVWLVVLALAVLLAVGLVVRYFGGDSRTSEAAAREPQRSSTADLRAPAALAAPDSEQRADVPATAPKASAAAPQAPPSSSSQVDPLAEVWALVAQLEALATKPASYHDQALPVIERLTEACRASDASDAERSPSVDVWNTLLTQVVRSQERVELVRGGVALAIARELPEADFWRLFDEWLALPREGSLELVRAAALAAALRGDETPCHRELGLSRLATMTGDEMERPGIYPLSLRRVASPGAGAVLRRWLDLPDPRRDLFRSQTPAIENARELASALDFFVAAEVLYCVWGHGAVVNSEVERELVRTALCENGDAATPDLLTLRAAHFVLRSLAECNAGLADGAHRASRSSIPVVAGLAKAMESVAGGGLGLKLMADIERLRYSRSKGDESDLLLLLINASETLAKLGRSRTAERQNAIEYLLALATDSNVTEMGRGAAAIAVVDNAGWAELLEVVRRVLTSGVTGMPNYSSLNALVEAAGDDAGRKAQARQMLEGLAASALGPGVLEMVNDAVSRLRS